MIEELRHDEDNEILEVLKKSPEGLSLKGIQKNLSKSFPVYTLRRRLADLQNRGKIDIFGKQKGTVYKCITSIKKPVENVPSYAKIEQDSTSEDIKKAIGQPILSRRPVGYNRDFLFQYSPNVSSYLPESVRQHLRNIGKTDGERPAGTHARQIYNRLLIDLSWNSSRLEGNTYSLLETERLLELSEIAEGKNIEEAQMILNHKGAIEFIIDNAEIIDITNYYVFNIHALLSENLLANRSACGALRKIPVSIGKSAYVPPVIPDLIEVCFNQVLNTARAIHDPFEQAFFLMVHLPYLQPFEDVNKRVSRLVANIPLIRLNLSPLSFIGVNQEIYINGLLAVYELNKVDLLRDLFIWAYEHSAAFYSSSRQTLGSLDPFRLRYRNTIMETVAYIIREKMDKKAAIHAIRTKASQAIPKEDQPKFIESLETELRSLHAGNIARFKVRPNEFEAWHSNWS